MSYIFPIIAITLLLSESGTNKEDDSPEQGGVLTLITKDGIPVAQGTKVGNNLYKMKVAVKTLKPLSTVPQIFSVTEPAQNWETWHK